MDQGFQWAITLACWAIVVMFLVQVVVWFLVYLIARQVRDTIREMRQKFEPQISQVLVTVGELQKMASDVTETVNTVSTEVRAVSAAVTTSAERISVLATDSAEEIREMIATASAEIKSLVASTSNEFQGLVKNTSNDVQGLVRNSSQDLRDAVQTTRSSAEGMVGRLELMVERTALRVEETGVVMQTQVLEPVREVSAIVIGIKTALETLLGYPERKQINQAYSEEELFI